MRRILAVKRGDVWAYKETRARGPLVPVRILDPGTHYDAEIRVRRLDDSAASEFWTRRVRLPCRWDDVESYLDGHPEIVRAEAIQDAEATDTLYRATADELFGIGKRALRQIVRDELHRALPRAEKLAYTYSEAASAIGVSRELLRREVDADRLVPSYVASKPLFPADELRRWLSTLPNEPA